MTTTLHRIFMLATLPNTLRAYALILILCFGFKVANAQTDPIITTWKQNPTNQLGFAGIPTNVQSVKYTATDVYVAATCIPGYDIGPWTNNPNTASNQNFVFKITRTPSQNSGNATAIGNGHIGVWSNGVSIFSASDARSYNNANVWHQDAYFWEGISFDTCLGHPAPNGEYHHHVSPKCLYNTEDSLNHAPIIGYAFDGFPVYGVWAYGNTTGGGGIKRMTTSYRKRNITTRTILPSGATAASAGPDVSATYPLGAYAEDYEYIQGFGTLDARNGRFAVTPDYPQGTYAYYVTISPAGVPLYPYVLATTYYGVVSSGNMGPGSGHNTAPANATVYSATAYASVAKTAIKLNVYPQPADGLINITLPTTGNVSDGTITIVDAVGKQVLHKQVLLTPSSTLSLDISTIPAGTYRLVLHTATGLSFAPIVKL